ncbi:MAG TPA: DNA primase [Candidatus Polarisedimenticolia bacterium]|nr:DNA primase [Candidatus Polarisedimenticolia bacterium]
MFAPDFVDKVRTAVDIVALVSEAVPLKKAGRKYRGLCPFHPEKTPSFYIDDEKGLFYCFGCQAGGDAFKFVMLRENVEFLEAARILAHKLGVPVTESRPGRRSERETLLAAHRAAVDFYHGLLTRRPQGKAALAYLEKRGISAETIERLEIGFAPEGWDALKGHLVGKGYTADQLVTGGLLSRKEGGSSTYDRFRNRVIFPIRNLSGEVIGLGGRILGDGQPKYLNSAETPIYNKRENLYGLDLSRAGIRETGEAVVVEGYLDFASLHQAGIANVVATLGTAFAEEQVSLLRRFTGRIVINYDPDTAGASATRRSIDLLLAHGFKVRVLQLEPGKDPDEFVRSHGLQEYRARLDVAPRYFDYLVDRAVEGRDLSDYEVKSSALKEMLPVLSQVPDRVERSGYVNALAERLGIDDALMLAELRDGVAKGGRPRLPARMETTAARVHEVDGRLVRALLEGPDVRAGILAGLDEEDLAGSPVEEIVRAISALAQRGDEVSYSRLSEVLREPARSLLARLAMKPEPGVSREEALRCVESMRLRRLRQERDTLQKMMEKELDAARLDELMRRKFEVSRQIDSLS